MKNSLFTLLLCLSSLCAYGLEVDFNALNARAKKHLINLVNIDTAMPEPDELGAARYIYKELNRYGIDWDIYLPRKDRANIMARLKGSDPSKKPLLLISHLDTADASGSWSYPPFKATEENGNIYGLGTTDAKNYTAAYLALFTWLKEKKIPLKRDVIFLATSGEESGGDTGLKWLAGSHWRSIKPGFAINEGGGVIKDKTGTDIVFAEASTKMYMDIKITAYGTGVHSSTPVNDNAVYLLSQALSKIANYNSQPRLTPTTHTFFKAIRKLQPEDAQTTIDFLLSDNAKTRQMAAEVMAVDSFFRSQLKDTINPTVIAASKDSGSASGEASAILNVRLLPDADPDQFLDNLKKLFEDDEHISLEIVERPRTPFPKPMDGTDALFAAISRTTARLLPGAVTVPGMSPASGDNEILRSLGVVTYGLGPDMNPLEKNSAHAPNEHINLEDFYNQLKFLTVLVADFAAGEEIRLPSDPKED